MPLTRIDSEFLDLDAIGGIDFDVQSGVPTFSVNATTHRVGIGTNSPDEKLEVYDGNIQQYSANASGGTGLILQNYADGGGGNVTPYSFIRAKSNPLRNAGEIRFGRDSAYGSAAEADSHISFWTALNDTNTEKLRITSDGRVGIATDNPVANFKLDVNGDLSLGENGGSDNTFIDQKQNGSLDIINSGRASNSGKIRINKTNSISGDTTYFRDFEVYDGKTNLLFLIDGSSGNVGIGTNQGDQILHINKAAGTTLFKASTQANSTIGLEIEKTGSTTQSWRIVDGQTVNGALEFYDVTNSTTRMIVRNGNIGIGTNNPGYKLHVTGGAIDLNSSSTAFGDGVRVGKNIIGYSGQKLTISSQSNGIYLEGTSNSIIQLDSSGIAFGNSPSSEIKFYPNTWTINNNPTITGSLNFASNVGINRTDPDQKLNVSGNIELNAYDNAGGSGGYFTSKGLIIGNLYDAGKSYTGSDDRTACIWQERGLDLDFATNDTLRIKITYDGKVGIGTNNPSTKLDVAGQAHFKNNGSSVKIESSPGTNFTQLQLTNTGGSFYVGRENNAGNWFGTGSNYASVLRSDGSYPMIFRVNSENRLHITSTGNIGVGTDTPTDKLSIYAAPNSLVLGAKDSTRGNHIFQLLADDAPGNGELRLYKNSGSGTHEKTVQIQSSGDSYFTGGAVGIGTDDPSSHCGLHIIGSSYWPILVKTTSVGGGGVAIKNKDDITSLYVGSGGSSWLTGSVITDGLIRAQNNIIFGSNGSNERLRITSAGLISFKNSSPPAWATDSGYANATFGSSGYLRTDTDVNSNFLSIGSNAYRHTDGWKHTNSGWATQLQTSANDGDLTYSVSTTSGSADGNITWSEKLRVAADGMITGGSNSSTGGSTIIQNRYSSTHILNILGSMYSTGATALTFGLRPRAGNSGFESSFSNFSGGRVAAVMQGTGLFIQTAAAQTTAVGNTVSVTTQVKIGVDGNVGIGTDTPSQKLNVVGNIMLEGNNQFMYLSDVGTGNAGIYVRGNSQSASSSSHFLRSHSTGYFTWEVAGSEKMQLTSGGNLGIGTDNPSSKLHVNGTVQVGKLADDTHEIKISTNAVQFNRTSVSYIDQKGTGDIRFRYGSNYDTWMHLEGSTANIGIGTDVPASRLHVHTSSGLSTIRLSGDAANQVEYDIRQGVVGVNNAGFSIRDMTNAATRFVIDSSGNIGVGADSPTAKLQVGTGRPVLINDGGIAIKGDSGGWAFGYTIQGSSGTDRGGFGGYGGANNLSWLWIGDTYASPTMVLQGGQGSVGIGTSSPAAKLHVNGGGTQVKLYNTTSVGKTTGASASTGGSQGQPAPTFRWSNPTAVSSTGHRGYEAWVQSGDAYPNSSNFFQLLIKNSSFYRVTVKRSHSSVGASVATMLIYGLANSTGNYKPVVHMSGMSGSGSGTGTAEAGDGYGSPNAVASFYWDIVSYNINTHDCIIKIATNSSNNQGIYAMVEKIG